MSKAIRFINANDPSEIISVLDQDSAFILSRVLSKNWSIEGQEPVKAEPAAVAAAPVAATPVLVTPVVSKPAESGRPEFRVILISGTSTFRCATRDVALDGATLKAEAPVTFRGKECTAYISHHDMKENIEISCQVVADESGVTRLKFVQPAKPELERLSEWMAAS